MKISSILSLLLLALGLICLLAGVVPRLRGGNFNSGFFPPGIALVLIGGAIRRRRRKEAEREGAARER